jgi:hypothetical protein
MRVRYRQLGSMAVAVGLLAVTGFSACGDSAGERPRSSQQGGGASSLTREQRRLFDEMQEKIRDDLFLDERTQDGRGGGGESR